MVLMIGMMDLLYAVRYDRRLETGVRCTCDIVRRSKGGRLSVERRRSEGGDRQPVGVKETLGFEGSIA